MTKSLNPTDIREQISRVRTQRRKLEKKLMAHRQDMIAACLVARRHLAGGKLRKTPAFYLSRKVTGKTRLGYVGKDRLHSVKRATDDWREFSSALARWVKLTARLERLFRDLGKAQIRSDSPEKEAPEARPGRGD